MPDDIRVSLSFRHHRKRKRLILRLGNKGLVALIDLWCTVAEQNPTGILNNYSKEDIEIDSGWTGPSGEFVSALLEIGFLEDVENGFYLHNWKKRQPWVANAYERSNISRFNRMSKTHNAIYKELQALDVRSISREDYDLLTSAKQPVKRSLEIFKERLSTTLSDCPKMLSPSPVPVPVPVPAPTKKTPVKSTGTNFQNNDVKNHDFTENLSDTFLKINSDCDEILKLPKDSKRKGSFDPRKWAQRQINNSKHPGAVSRSLDGLKTYWDRSRDPWSYLDHILGKVNGNFNESESISIHEELKKIKPGELSKFTHGLLEAI